MTKFVNHSDNKGFCKMNKKWDNKGVPKNKVAEGQKKVKINDKRLKFKA